MSTPFNGTIIDIRDSTRASLPKGATTRRSAWPASPRPPRLFERYHGYPGGGTNQWYPDLVQDQQQP